MRSIILSLWFISFAIFANGQQVYLDKFNQYQEWNNNLPSYPTPGFIYFITQDSPLNNKLRKKWLYYLAEKKHWALFAIFYKNEQNSSLQCYALTALHALGGKQQALKKTEPLWLTGQSLPKACDKPFAHLLKNSPNKNALIKQRIQLALQNKNVSLARYLLKQRGLHGKKESNLLYQIYRQPSSISKLEFEELHSDFYLYGLKRLVVKNMDQAISYWEHAKTKKLINEQQQQAFLVYISLYKAMRNHEDTPIWFAKIKPEFYTQSLLNWQIRYALKNRDWKEVKGLMPLLKDADNLSNQYWLARALEALGKKDKAHTLYEKISLSRNYYGFLASLRIKKPLNFEHEETNQNLSQLNAYKPITDEIKHLFESSKKHSASLLINDFVLELPKNERSSLAYWLAHELGWYEKALYISNNEVLHNQIALRFPLAHEKWVTNFAQKFHLSPEFVFAIIRQESTFRKKVVSHAGAYGLMQLLPQTAQQMARKEKIHYSGQNHLFSPSVNIQLGSAYLKYLSARFKHHPVLVAAAYNAGPRQVKHWLKNHPPKDVDVWIETLPWYETRNYLKNIVAFYAVYQYRLGHESDLDSFLKPFH